MYNIPLASYNSYKLILTKIVGVNAETVTNVTSTDFPGHHPGEDHEWSLEKFAQVLASLLSSVPLLIRL